MGAERVVTDGIGKGDGDGEDGLSRVEREKGREDQDSSSGSGFGRVDSPIVAGLSHPVRDWELLE